MGGLIGLAVALLGAFVIWRLVESEIKREREEAYNDGFARGSDDGYYRGFSSGKDYRRGKWSEE